MAYIQRVVNLRVKSQKDCQSDSVQVVIFCRELKYKPTQYLWSGASTLFDVARALIGRFTRKNNIFPTNGNGWSFFICTRALVRLTPMYFIRVVGGTRQLLHFYSKWQEFRENNDWKSLSKRFPRFIINSLSMAGQNWKRKKLKEWRGEGNLQ